MFTKTAIATMAAATVLCAAGTASAAAQVTHQDVVFTTVDCAGETIDFVGQATLVTTDSGVVHVTISGAGIGRSTGTIYQSTVARTLIAPVDGVTTLAWNVMVIGRGSGGTDRQAHITIHTTTVDGIVRASVEEARFTCHD